MRKPRHIEIKNSTNGNSPFGFPLGKVCIHLYITYHNKLSIKQHKMIKLIT